MQPLLLNLRLIAWILYANINAMENTSESSDDQKVEIEYEFYKVDDRFVIITKLSEQYKYPIKSKNKSASKIKSHKTSLNENYTNLDIGLRKKESSSFDTKSRNELKFIHFNFNKNYGLNKPLFLESLKKMYDFYLYNLDLFIDMIYTGYKEIIPINEESLSKKELEDMIRLKVTIKDYNFLKNHSSEHKIQNLNTKNNLFIVLINKLTKLKGNFDKVYDLLQYFYSNKDLSAILIQNQIYSNTQKSIKSIIIR